MLKLENVVITVSNEFSVNIPKLNLNNGIYHLIGANGSGKSTLTNFLAGMNCDYKGVITLNDSDISPQLQLNQTKLRSYLVQKQPMHFSLTAIELLAYALGVSEKEFSKRYINHPLLIGLDITMLLYRPLHLLSGGEQQRCQLVRVLLATDETINPQCKLLLLDEPYTGLDIKHSLWLNSYLNRLKERLIIIICHHELNFALRSNLPVIMLYKGKIYQEYEQGTLIKKQHLIDVFELDETTLIKEKEGYQQISWI